MNETLGRMSEQITTFFDKYDKKQKIKMFGVAALVIAALAILIIVLNQPRMVMLSENLTTKQAADIRDLLQENDITHKVASDGTSIEVDSKQLADAKMVLGQNGIPATGFTYEDAFNSSFSTTETEKQKKYQLAFEQELSESIRTMDGISGAIVNLVMPDQDRTIFDENKISKASAILTTDYDISSEQVQGIVNFLAASVENLEPDNVKIIDQKGKILYLGEEDDFSTNIGSQYEYINQRSSQMKRDVMSALLGTGLFDDAEVVVNLVMDFDKQASVSEMYSTPEGQTTGIPQSEYHYESTGANTAATGVPGTDANDITEYMMPDGNTSESETLIDQTEYNVNKTTTTSEKSLGQLVYDESSIAVVLNQYRVYDEEVLENQGLLEDITFEEFKEQNMDQNLIAVDEGMLELVRSATGIQNVSVIGYEVPVFYSKTATPRSWTNYILLGLTILIVALLAFVVYKGTETVEVTEIAPELSVEDMLATTREQQRLDNIEFDDKSETRKHIEKFVEDKPDAVAQLLRNWLNEDWE